MSYSPGDRVVLLKSHAGIPAGSLGTVVNGTAVTTIVDFDADPSRSILVPNTLLAPAGLAAAQAQQVSWSAARGTHTGGAANAVLWFPPSVVAPGVGAAANFIAVTATPNVLSLLMQHVQLSVRGSVTSGCWIGSLDFPVSGGPAKLKVDVRGVAEQPKGAKTSIFIIIGAVVKSISFDDERSGDFTQTFDATIGDEPVQTITIVLLAERLAETDEVLFGVDSLDITAVK